ncbi:UV-damage endonuclease [Arachnomyces sp. PD_36]|nr:UV-damage endonuclease [Arachnomyces sp. PD_36]
MPLKSLHSFSVATSIQHGLRRKLNVPQPWWRQKYPGSRRFASSLTAIPKNTTPPPSETSIPRSNPSLRVTHGENRSPMTASVSRNPTTSPVNASGASADVGAQMVSGNMEDTSSSLSSPPDDAESQPPRAIASSKAKITNGVDEIVDPEANADIPANEEEVKEALSRPPPVNSDYLPLPWKGRLGYACLCTYLRYSTPPVFSSRTCRIASILENRHPLKDPSKPHHATSNRPDREQPPEVHRGQAFVEALGLANARDIVKMIRWNDRYGIKFMRLSSDMFPFASHEIYGYKLAPFASEVLAEAGRVAGELGHRLTVHPGQFTQLGSPRKEVLTNSILDLEYHSEMLRLLKLPPQQDRDAVMILHMGGVYGDKSAALGRFRENYKKLSQDIKNRLVLENDDVSWSVHDLLPVCEELNIPLVLDYHHHNIIFDADQIREGTLDIMQLYERIAATWSRKGITQKMHYSEPTPSAITNRQRRKHSPRVSTLPPCDPTMDLMIEAKDKEQAVFELMRTFKLPGFDKFNDMIPHVRTDENKPVRGRKKTAKNNSSPPPTPPAIPDGEVGMGGTDRRVYWPPGMEEWLRPVKRTRKKAEPAATPTKKAQKTSKSRASSAKGSDKEEEPSAPSTPKTPRRGRKKVEVVEKTVSKKRKVSKKSPSPSSSLSEAPELSEDEVDSKTASSSAPTPVRRRSGRAKAVNYEE